MRTMVAILTLFVISAASANDTDMNEPCGSFKIETAPDHYDYVPLFMRAPYAKDVTQITLDRIDNGWIVNFKNPKEKNFQYQLATFFISDTLQLSNVIQGNAVIEQFEITPPCVEKEGEKNE